MENLAKTQTKLYGLDEHFNVLRSLYDDNKLPNKILLTGKRGVGKSTLTYHFINYIFSKNEEHKYDYDNFVIKKENRS